MGATATNKNISHGTIIMMTLASMMMTRRLSPLTLATSGGVCSRVRTFGSLISTLQDVAIATTWHPSGDGNVTNPSVCMWSTDKIFTSAGRLAVMLEGVVRIGAVNCQEEWMVCRQQGITGYPSLKLYTMQHGTVKFQGRKEQDDILAFLVSFLPDRMVRSRSSLLHTRDCPCRWTCGRVTSTSGHPRARSGRSPGWWSSATTPARA